MFRPLPLVPALAAFLPICPSTSAQGVDESLVSNPELAPVVAHAIGERGLEAVWQVGTPFPGIEAGWQAPNRAQGLRTWFLPEGVRVMPFEASRDGRALLELSLSALARGDWSAPAGSARLAVTGTRAEYQRRTVVEWYENRADGIEQGFDLEQPPGDRELGPLELVLELEGGLTATSIEPRRVEFEDSGGARLALGGLYAWDADGRTLDCRFARRGAQLALVVEDGDARYPVTVDPTIVNEEARLVPTLPPPTSRFGTALDMTLDVAVVGAVASSPSSVGAAYVFRRGPNGWEQEAKFHPSLTGGSSYDPDFGTCVSVDGTRVAVGAPRQGRAYTYRYAGGRWALSSSPTAQEPNTEFGSAIDLRGDLLAVGAPKAIEGLFEVGAVHVFELNSSGNYHQLARLVAPSPQVGGRFGEALDFAFGLLAIGEPGRNPGGAVYVLETGGFTTQAFLTRPSGDLGSTVGIEGEYLAAGSPETKTVHFYRKLLGTWTLLSSVASAAEGTFGASLEVDVPGSVIRVLVGDPLAEVDGVNDAGRVYRFHYTPGDSGLEAQGSWSAPAPGLGARFGSGIAAFGTNALIGASHETLGGLAVGGVHVLEDSGTSWNEVDLLHGSDHDNLEYFARSIALAPDLAVIGAEADADSGIGSGAAFVFERQAGEWRHVARLSATPHSSSGARFGGDVATDGETIVVGAAKEDHSGLSRPGAAYVFQRSAGPPGWALSARLEALDPIESARFGEEVEVDGDFIAVAATGALNDLGVRSGVVYTFLRTAPGAWSDDARLSDPAGEMFDAFGGVLAARGTDELLVGVADGEATGSVRVFRRTNGTWAEQAVLSSPRPGRARFGNAIDLGAGRLAVGSPHLDEPGRVYTYTLVAGDWTLDSELTGPADQFGFSVGVEGGVVAVGATDAAFAFQRAGGLWVCRSLVPAAGPGEGIQRVAVSGSRVLVGDDDTYFAPDSFGQSWVFLLMPVSVFQPFDPVPVPVAGSGGSPGDAHAPGTRHGSLHPAGGEARLEGTGSASLAASDMRLTASGLPPNRACQLVVRETLSGHGTPFQGDRRLLLRNSRPIGGIRTSTSQGTVEWSKLISLGLWAPGDTCAFQVLYRDPTRSAWGTSINASNGLRVAFER